MFSELQRRLERNPYIQHILVVLTVPIVYPKIPLAEGLMGGISSELVTKGQIVYTGPPPPHV